MGLIIVDQSEPFVIIEELKQLTGVEVTFANKQGYLDYTFFDYLGHPITVERKEVHDLSGRVNDLEQQLRKALLKSKKVGGHVALLVEGLMHPIEGSTVLYRQKADGSIYYQERVINRPYTYYSRFEIRLWTMGISVFKTSSQKETAYFLSSLAKTCSEDPNTSHIFKKIYVDIQEENPQVKTLMGLGLGQQVSQALIKGFTTAWAVITATPEQLTSLKGVGEATVKRINVALGR